MQSPTEKGVSAVRSILGTHMTIKQKEIVPENTPAIYYRWGFSAISVIMLVTILATRIHRIGGGLGGSSFMAYVRMTLLTPDRIFSYLLMSAPFLILAFMTARWAWLKRDFSRKDFICRVSGILSVYFIYLHMVRHEVAIAEITHIPLEKWFYTFSIPWLIPVLYGAGYAIAWYFLTPWSDKVSESGNDTVKKS